MHQTEAPPAALFFDGSFAFRAGNGDLSPRSAPADQASAGRHTVGTVPTVWQLMKWDGLSEVF